MKRRVEQGAGFSDLDNFPRVHDSHPARALRQNPDVVRDKKSGQAGVFSKLIQQIQNFPLHRDVQRGGGLVRD
jgi:hypothetical protein